jgi:hypothetical protein
MRFGYALILAGVLPLVLAAGPHDISRVVKLIDFEERRLGNREDLPMHWTKVEGDGLPVYVNGKLSDDLAHGGQWSFKFELNGGSLIYRYDPNEVRAKPGGHYRISCFVATTALPQARARLTAYFADADGHAIPGTTVHSPLFAATNENHRWHELSTELSADSPACAQIAVELELLQPSFYQTRTLGERTLFNQDIHGAAWFDDVCVAQVPRIVLSTGRPGNVFHRSDPLGLDLLVNDRFISDLAEQVFVKDAGGAVVYQHSAPLDPAKSTGMVATFREFPIPLPDLKPGWYDAALTLTSGTRIVEQDDLHIVRLADDETQDHPDRRFGIIATDLPNAGWDQLPELMPIMAAGRVKLALWSLTENIEHDNPGGFDALLDQLQKGGVTTTACLTGLPPDIADKLGTSSWTDLPDSDGKAWKPDLAYMVARHAGKLDRWQFGADAKAAEMAQSADLRRVYQLLYSEIDKVVVNPDLAMPWPAWSELGKDLPVTVALSVPSDVLPDQLPLYIQNMSGLKGHNLSLSLNFLDRSYGREVQIRDMAQRVVYALAGGATRIDLPLPFTIRRETDHVSDEPEESLVILRTLLTQLANAKFLGKLPGVGNVDALLFDRDGTGVVVLWNRDVEETPQRLALNLGAHPQRIDLWGNAKPLFAANDENSDSIVLEVGPMPVFLVDVDESSAEMRASVGIDQPLLESSFEPHTRHIHFTNPGNFTVSGAVKLAAPKGWTLQPSIFNFTLNPGEVFDHEITLAFPYNSFAGPKTITANFQMQGDRASTFSVPFNVILGLSDVGMRTIALRDNGDLVVQQLISNYGDKPIDYTAFVVYPGQPRQERLVTHLGPGRTLIKLYRFPGAEIIRNAKVRSGLREMEGTRILNDEVDVQ